ncbi:MAG: hypothetical protein J0626_10000 [Rhodospirillaceae bacterium]|jgi:hypothetical protein|uniref:Uncharacterized protein n=1 Tax=Sphingomonas colocasiae TaxID=1848973 RepID=A0ABS7Q0E5_9SPHN|nr:hypothetical protein [Sphingomonas colocasiae]MBV5325552.1 hypothetical protein [Rhodospirillaceae bacterium]MBY8826037.1 hypothetical protein [Sphingomonas colocasiae]
MAMTRSAIFGALAALGVPTILRDVDVNVAEFIYHSSTAFNIAGIWLRWSWPVFVLVTLLSFILLQVSRNK